MTSKKQKAKRKTTEKPSIQLWDGSWYKIDTSYWHECCDCGLTHSVDYKLENGVIFMRWSTDRKQTNISRKLREKKDD